MASADHATSAVHRRAGRGLALAVRRGACPAERHLLGRLAPQRGDLLGPAQRAQARRSSPATTLIAFDEPSDFASTSWTPAASRMRARRAAGDHAGTGRGRLEQHAGGVVLADRSGAVIVEPASGTSKRFLRGLLHALLDGGRHLLGLAVAEADVAVAVADDDERGEREPPAALDDLGDAVDRDHPLFELAFGHAVPSSSELEPGFAGAVGDRRDPAVVLEAAAVEHDAS